MFGPHRHYVYLVRNQAGRLVFIGTTARATADFIGSSTDLQITYAQADVWTEEVLVDPSQLSA